ncbi:MAG: glutathione-dependent formaldehyde dehydrogenase [Gemmatimonadota bacterium]|nr:glutathione-dependent formaldehyde dehydrogenase [Gemmatimonadota bacterium]
MKALCWMGTNDVRVETVPDPEILNPRDAIVRVTSTAICGSDLHLVDGYIPSMRKGDILGHEFMGEVVETGAEVKKLSVGDRVIVPFTIACGSCFFCKRDEWSLCDNTNPNAVLAEKMWGHSGSGAFGYSHITGGYAGGQAEYVRVPFADVNPFKVNDGLTDEQVLFLTDILPTGYMAAENCDIQPDDTVAVWGCGPVGQFAIASAKMLGAARVIAIDRFPERLAMAERQGGVETINYEEIGNTLDLVDVLSDMTSGMGPDACIDAVGLEAHGVGIEGWYDKAKQAVRAQTERPVVLRQTIMACRKGGTVSVPGVYGGLADKIPVGAFMNKALTLRTGQTHVHRYVRPLLERIRNGEIDPSFIITHRMPLSEATQAYDMFKHKHDDCVKVVLQAN